MLTIVLIDETMVVRQLLDNMTIFSTIVQLFKKSGLSKLFTPENTVYSRTGLTF